jgi:hypothetical protein
MKLKNVLRRGILVLGSALICTAYTTAMGTDYDNTSMGRARGHYGKRVQKYIPWTFPGINISSQPGFGADWGTAALGVGFQNRARFTQVADGALGAAVGMGDATNYIGVEADVSMFSFHDASRGGLMFKVHRRLPYSMGVAVGVENAASWGGTDAPRTYYGAFSKVFALTDYPSDWFSALTLTAGAGNGRFLSQNTLAQGKDGVNPFGSAALRIQEPVSLIVDWSGQDLNLGLSITPLRDWGLFINPSLADVTRNAGDGMRFVMGVGFGYVFI